MHPVLVPIPFLGGFIYSYGFFVALGFLAGMFWISRESKRCGEDSAKAMDLTFYVIVAAIVGSRIFHVLVSERERFFENPLMIFKIWEGGLVFYGGLIACVLVSIWYMRRFHLSFWTYSDIFAPAISLGHALGRIGCLMAGCCYGRALSHNAWYALTFPNDPHSFAPAGLPLYPTQPMETLGEFLIFGLLMIVRGKKRFSGQLLASYLILYAVLRTFIEYFRGDVSRGFVIEPWLSTSQFISILIFFAGVTIYFKRWKK